MEGQVGESKSTEKKAAPKSPKPAAKKDDLSSMTTEQLNQKLQEYLENEEYEKAAAVRDELTKRE
jgi:protein-arginine kinase activator protein McsA